MSVAWTLQGQAAKALDATVRSLEALAVDSATLSIKSLDVDEFTFSISPQDVMTATIPELGQTVTLFRNGSRFFHGHVIDNPVTIQAGNQTTSVVVAGPWWWLERVNLTSTKTDGTGATAERLSFVFGTTSGGVDLKTAIENLMDRAIALGAPFQRGTVATFFQVPRITLNQSTCAQALAELIRLCPDTMATFDYSTSPPTLNVTRRATATVATLTVGTSPIESITIRPVYEMKVDRVDLDYVTRDVQGRTQYVNQGSGTAATGRNLRLNISGPELDTFLPNNLFDSFPLQTAATAAAGAPFKAWVIAKNAELSALMLKYSWTAATFPLGVSTGSVTNTTTAGQLGMSGAFTFYSLAPVILTSKGLVATLTGKNLILSDKPPEWATQYTVEEVTVVVDMVYTSLNKDVSAGVTTNYADPTWFNDITWTTFASRCWAIGSNSSSYQTYSAYKKTVEVKGYLINASAPTVTTIYRPADYTFLNPPAGLAANLKAAQDFVPYAGSIDLTEEDAAGTLYGGKVVNIASSFSAYSTMKALVSSVTYDIKNGGTAIELGTPPRLDFRSFTDRIRRTPQDNIEYL